MSRLARRIERNMEMRLAGSRPTQRQQFFQPLIELRFRRTAEAHQRPASGNQPLAQLLQSSVVKKYFRVVA